MATRLLKKRRKRPAGGAAPKPAPATGARYHHGSLHAALIEAAAAVLARDGLSGLTLRAAAREAGVSHAAPAHHFGDISGLLSELAAAGFRSFAARLGAATASATSAAGRMEAMGQAYVAFAREHPSMFLLMFRSERLDLERPALREAVGQAFGMLMRGASERRGSPAPAPALALLADTVRAWSMVHGFAMLLIDHRLDPILSRLPKGTDADDLLQAMISGK